MSSEGAKTFTLEIVKPNGHVLTAEVEECVIPGELGSFGVLAGHTPFIAQVGVGEIMYRTGNTKSFLAVDGGFCEVRPSKVTVLAESAERSQEIDLERASRAKDRAAEQLGRTLQGEGLEKIDLARRKLRRAEVRLGVARKRPSVA